jgi:hypothetical protein
MRDGRGKTVGPEISAADMTDMKSGGLLCPATQGDQITDKSKPAPRRPTQDSKRTTTLTT